MTERDEAEARGLLIEGLADRLADCISLRGTITVLGGRELHPVFLRHEVAAIVEALRTPSPAIAEVERALEFYATHGAGCRKVTSEGNDSRHALDKDGGKHAADALASLRGRA